MFGYRSVSYPWVGYRGVVESLFERRRLTFVRNISPPVNSEGKSPAQPLFPPHFARTSPRTPLRHRKQPI
ncbi:hypothetical protein [Mycobacterium phage WXIN]|nr:hypothetical protein [Mycobacterium phage WXIN]